ncbi:MAG: hypothetical protein ABJB03_03545 [Rhodoglobus sp.]
MKRTSGLAYFRFIAVGGVGVFATFSTIIAVLLTIRAFKAGTVSAVIDLVVFLAFVGAMVGLCFVLLAGVGRASAKHKGQSLALRTEYPDALILMVWSPRSVWGGILKVSGTNRGLNVRNFYFLRIDQEGLALMSGPNHAPVLQAKWDAVRELRSPSPPLSMTQQVFVVIAAQKGDRRYQLRMASTKLGDGRLDASEMSRLNTARP